RRRRQGAPGAGAPDGRRSRARGDDPLAHCALAPERRRARLRRGARAPGTARADPPSAASPRSGGARRGGSAVRWSRNVLLVFGLLALALIGVRLYLPTAVRNYVNGVLERNGEYTGRVADVDLALWRGA